MTNFVGESCSLTQTVIDSVSPLPPQQNSILWFYELKRFSFNACFTNPSMMTKLFVMVLLLVMSVLSSVTLRNASEELTPEIAENST